MSSMRKSNKLKGYQGDGTRYIAIPFQVLESDAYLNLSHPARSLLLEIARQFVRNNNGALLCSRAKLLARGWTSNDVLTRAKRELLDAGLIFETVKGHRPNRASWYALTWYDLDKLTGYDAGVERGFQRSAYKYKLNSTSKLLENQNLASADIALPHHGSSATDTTKVCNINGATTFQQLRIRPDLLHNNVKNISMGDNLAVHGV